MTCGLDGLLRVGLLDEAELDQDVRQEAPARAVEARLCDARNGQGRPGCATRDLARQRVGAHASPMAGAVPSGVPFRRAGADCAAISASSTACWGDSASASRWMPYDTCTAAGRFEVTRSSERSKRPRKASAPSGP